MIRLLTTVRYASLRNLIKCFLSLFIETFVDFFFQSPTAHTGKRRAWHQANARKRKSLAAINARRTVQARDSQHRRQLPGRKRDRRYTES